MTEFIIMAAAQLLLNIGIMIVLPILLATVFSSAFQAATQIHDHLINLAVKALTFILLLKMNYNELLTSIHNFTFSIWSNRDFFY